MNGETLTVFVDDEPQSVSCSTARFILLVYNRSYTTSNFAAGDKQIESDMNRTSAPHSSRCKGGNVSMHRKPHESAQRLPNFAYSFLPPKKLVNPLLILLICSS